MEHDTGNDPQAYLLAMTPRLRGYLHLVMRDFKDVEDTLQEVFLKYLSRGPAPGSPAAEGWLFQVARHEALNAIRSDRRRRQRERAPRQADPWPPQDPAEAAGRLESVRRMDAALHRLDLERREILYLKVVEGLSVREIADRLGLPKSTVDDRAREALALLNRAFQTEPCHG